ncbi:hypothetical protein [Nonomuraea zeae]|uniref:Uncharacterized protein n=1 Tax=Nonomuraea zeae TaxID=1642303 RepID=A0A5S4H5R9_9ACTN|nr:hypothetical protein [Nonomuraea zeae]TMR34210.1 hypothetical protein ETD85_17355 [Nonomuraea zeae]
MPTDPAINLSDSCWPEPRPATRFVPTTTPTLGAEVVNPDDTYGDQVSARFEWADAAGTVLGSATSTPGSAGRHCTKIPDEVLADGQTYRWRVRAEDRYQEPETLEILSGAGDWTAWQEFTVDVTRPALPVIASETYPENATGGLVGTPGLFTFSPGESTDVVSYRYRLTPGSPPPATVTADAGGRAGVTLTPRRNPAPLATSTVYPDNAPGGGAGVPGEFAFSPNGAQDVIAYGYRLDSGETLQSPADTPTVTITPDTAGPHTLSVWSIDARGYLSSARAYAFTVN